MKRVIIIAILIAAVPFGLNAQNDGFDKLIKKYDGRKGITAVNLEGNILEGITYFLSQLSSDDGDEAEPFDYSGYYDEDDDEETVEIVEFCVPEIEDNCIVAPDYPVAAAVAVDSIADDSEEGEEAEADVDYESYDEYVYVYGEEGDYDYDDDDDDYSDFDYSSYYSPYSGLNNYLGMFKAYFDGLKFLKGIMYENPTKKFEKDVKKLVVGTKPYKCIVSMNTGGEEVRMYTIDDEAAGTCEILVIVKEGNQYIVGSVLGSRDFKGLIDIMKEFM